MHLLGGKALFLSSDDIQLGVNETLKVMSNGAGQAGSYLNELGHRIGSLSLQRCHIGTRK